MKYVLKVNEVLWEAEHDYFQWECRQYKPDWLKIGTADVSRSRTALLKLTLLQSLAKRFDYIANRH
jgi:hypothetical protein